jgi:hypothetical protein
MVTTLGEAKRHGDAHGAINLAVSWYDATISFHQFLNEEDARRFCRQNQLTYVEESNDDDIES